MVVQEAPIAMREEENMALHFMYAFGICTDCSARKMKTPNKTNAVGSI